jgi:hypothetical protein
VGFRLSRQRINTRDDSLVAFEKMRSKTNTAFDVKR